MRGNVYISIPAADKDNALPSSITRYDWNTYTYDDEGAVDTTTLVHPTWAEYGEKYKADFGAAVSVSVNDVEYIVYEITASWKDSEISALIALGSGLSSPNYTLMNTSEARTFIADNTDSQL
jgi:hypothetical protein